MNITLSHGSNGELIADIEITLDVAALRDQYEWVKDHIDESNEHYGLVNMLGDIDQAIADAEERIVTEAEMQDALSKRDEALENHFDMREHYEEM